MVFKRDLTPVGKGGIKKHAGKGSVQQRLPHRMAPQTITPGAVGDRMMQQYGKQMPDMDSGNDALPTTDFGA